ncbi:MAG: ComEA family DNA-binding protein [Acidimicrobiales bacterium]
MTAAATAPEPPDTGADPGRDPWDRISLVERFVDPRVLAVPWRDRPRLLAGAGLAVAAIVALGWWLGRPSSAGPIDEAIPFASAPAADAGSSAPLSAGGGGSGGGAGPPGPTGTAPAPGTGTDVPAPVDLVVHVAGAVIRPGIVHLAAGARVVDAIDAAGGAADGADLDQLNLAAPLGDGVQVRVPREGETLVAPISPAPAAPGGGGPGAPAPAVVDLNRATAAELEQLPGIGPSLAAAIVTWRTEHGPFKRVDDLLDVPGIGPAKMTTLGDRVTV